MQQHLLVIGGGAAGFFCAVNAARMNPALKVTLAEKGNKLLSKVRVSGGGRCNLTHACDSIAEMSNCYPRGQHFVKKNFHHFFVKDTIEWFTSRGVELKVEADGRMFPVSDSSETIIHCLVREANQHKVEMMLNADVKSLLKKGETFEAVMADGRKVEADFVCIASGGFPKPEQFNWITSLGHHIATPVPSLFTFNLPKHPLNALMGVVADPVRVKIEGTKLSEEGPVLITHWGLSGPGILRLSAWGARDLAERDWHFTVHVNWLPDLNEESARKKLQEIRFETAGQKITARNVFGLPQRLWEFFVLQSGIKPDTRWADLPAKEQNKLAKTLCDSVFEVKGKTTFKEEFVTAGGIELKEVEAGTMESKIVPGLFFAGEILDVDGITGGYNFQHAWSSGFLAAQSVADRTTL